MKYFAQEKFIIDQQLADFLRGAPSNYKPYKDKKGLYLVHINPQGFDKEGVI